MINGLFGTTFAYCATKVGKKCLVIDKRSHLGDNVYCENIEGQKAEAVAALNGREPANLEAQALTFVGKDIFEKLIKEYTEKQWDRNCKELLAFIIKRLPVRLVFGNNYFNDRYQGIPIGGYNKLIDGLLDGVETRTGVDFFCGIQR